MASPIAHSFAGFWTFLLLPSRFKTWIAQHWRPTLLRLAVLVLLANLPDLDFFMELGFNANQLHRGFTHSLMAGIVVSLGLSYLWRMVPGFWRSALLYFAAYSSHLLIDLCTGSTLGWTHTGSGQPLFWPWHAQFSSPLILIYGVRHGNMATLFSLDNIWSCTYELLTFGAITIFVLALRARFSPSLLTSPRPKPTLQPLAKLQQD